MGKYQRNPGISAQTYINMIQLGMSDTYCNALTFTVPRVYVQEVLSAYKETHRFLLDKATNPRLVRVTVYTNVHQ